jgi:hypothetical protein
MGEGGMVVGRQGLISAGAQTSSAYTWTVARIGLHATGSLNTGIRLLFTYPRPATPTGEGSLHGAELGWQ